ncbi:MAG: ABC transporter substrate binding protein [Pseudomonadota bacterium]
MNNGKKWRIAYYEGGEYRDYQKVFIETIAGLMKLGWIEKAEIPPQEGEQTKELWKWLTTNASSEYLDFVVDAHYSAEWNDKLRTKIVEVLMERVSARKDVDLLIAMGTQAGKDFANGEHSVPTMVLSTSNALASGIIKSVEDSGFDHVHARVDPKRYDRQVRVFHEIVGFKTLGVAYEDSVNGRSYAAMDAVEKVAEERGFEIVRCFTKTDIADTAEAEQTVIDCFNELASKVDAIYVTVQQGVTTRTIPEMVKLANDHSLPTFSQSGSEEVRLGFLVSMSRRDFKKLGEFHSETFAKVFNGANPNQLNQLYEEPPKIALNLKTAETIGFDPPVVILGAADEIFNQ